MKVTEAMTGGGGWPMTVFLTPDKHAFFAGTYFPKESLAGRPGFKLIVTELHKAWMESATRWNRPPSAFPPSLAGS